MPQDLEWLLNHGQRAADLAILVDGFCRHLRATGLLLARASINVRILHPLRGLDAAVELFTVPDAA